MNYICILILEQKDEKSKIELLFRFLPFFFLGDFACVSPDFLVFSPFAYSYNVFHVAVLYIFREWKIFNG